MRTMPASVRYIFTSALFFAMMTGCVKAASLRGIPFLEILAVRAFISVGISYIDIRRKNISPWGNDILLLTARGVAGTIALMCIFYAVTSLPLAEATLLQYFYPVFTSILAFIFLKEKIQKSTAICIVLSLTGLFIIVQGDLIFDNILPKTEPLAIIGVVAALVGSLGTSFAYVLVRKLSKTEDPSVIIFYFPFVAFPVSCLLLGSDLVIPKDITVWILLLLVGIFTQIAQFFLTLAIKNEKTAKVTAFSYVQILFSVVIGWAFFAEIPTLRTLLGALFIIGGAMINILSTQEQ